MNPKSAHEPPDALTSTSRNVTAIAETLRSERATLSGRLRPEAGGPLLGTGSAPSAEGADGLVEDLNSARREALFVRLTQIDRALRRIAAGGYGACEECGEPIDPRRLNADPAVTLCGPCRQASEPGLRPRTM